LLPIAYLTFFLLMNSKKALGEDLPKKRWLINTLLLLAIAVATFASFWALTSKYASANPYEQYFGLFGLIGLPILAGIGIWSFVRKER